VGYLEDCQGKTSEITDFYNPQPIIDGSMRGMTTLFKIGQ